MNVELRWDFYRKRKEKNVTSHEKKVRWENLF